MRFGLAGVSIRELLIEPTRLFVEGSHVELLDAHLVDDWLTFLPVGPVVIAIPPLLFLLTIEIRCTVILLLILAPLALSGLTLLFSSKLLTILYY